MQPYSRFAHNIEHIAQMADQQGHAAASSHQTAAQLDTLAMQLRDTVAHYKI